MTWSYPVARLKLQAEQALWG